jgi:putative metallohydrolase (TIGR04338 family)
VTVDRHRSAVYAAEDHLQRLLADGGVVDFHGSMLDIAPERKFGDLNGAQRYLDALRATSWGYSDTPRPLVVRRRGPRQASWRAPHTIAIPDDESWAMRESVLLHEYAHHVAFHRHGESIHGRQFCSVLVDLMGAAMSPGVGLLLRAGFTDAGIFPDPRRVGGRRE